MKLRKRGNTYWIDAVVDGVRIQRSLHTKDKRDATTKAHDVISEAKQGKITTASIGFAKLPFCVPPINLSRASNLRLKILRWSRISNFSKSRKNSLRQCGLIRSPVSKCFLTVNGA